MNLFHWIASGVCRWFSPQRKLKKLSRLRVVNQTRGTVLAESMEVADSAASRNKGLLGRDRLLPGEGLWILPCESVHTFWMRFSIDLIYLDRKKRIRKLTHSLPPWRLSGCLRAYSVLELPSGTLRASQTQLGDVLEFSSASEREDDTEALSAAIKPPAERSK
jgi:uncharacterized membrane protein (UPF0127 family)